MMDDALAVVDEFWARMATNDWERAAELLDEGFTLDWPQSGERIRGRSNFARVNAEYPAYGRWVFKVHQRVGGGGRAVTDVSVTDGVQTARAVSFFTLKGGRIVHIVEFWPEPYPPSPNRGHLVERMEEE